jgi:RNA polymerase sigma-70 factor (ECF subfamily)
MPNISDQNHDRFLRLFAEHEPAVRTFARSLLPSLSDVSEVMQEVAVVLWQKFPEFDASRDFRKWAFGVARYQVLAHLRETARDRHVFNDELVGRLADDGEAADQRHEAHREALEACLGKLPEPQRELVLSAYTKGTRMDVLAARSGRTAMSLYKLLHRIRQALLQCVRRAIAREELT